MLQKELVRIRKEVIAQLRRAGVAYLQNGLEILHKVRKDPRQIHQTAVGNLSTAIELLLKSFISHRVFPLLFRELPLELRLFLSQPEAYPSGHKILRHVLTLPGFEQKTIKLNDCITLFLLLCPDKKQELKPYLMLMSNVRNLSVHGALPDFTRYEMERIAYLALKLVESIRERDGFALSFKATEADKKFLLGFNDKRIKKVHQAVLNAQKEAKALSEPQNQTYPNMSWEEYPGECPVCGRDGTYCGETEYEMIGSDDEDIDGELTFFPNSFHCAECGLKLDDFEELKLAGLDGVFDRSEEWQDYCNDVLYEQWQNDYED
jgi:rubredoxin